jgi:hypothetical protein
MPNAGPRTDLHMRCRHRERVGSLLLSFMHAQTPRVDGGDAVEAVGQFVGRVSERQHDSCVVEGHVKPAELGDGAIDERGDLILVGNIARDAQDPMALGTQLLGRGAQRSLTSASTTAAPLLAHARAVSSPCRHLRR